MKKIISVLALCFLFAGQAFGDVYVGGKKLILPDGDSLTEGVGDAVVPLAGYRDHLQDEIGTTQWEIVGAQVKPVYAAGYKTNHNGYSSGSTAHTEESTPFALTRYFTPFTPEGSVVILWVGTNDVSRTISGTPGYSQANARDNIEDILDLIRTHNTNIRVLVVNLGPNGDATRDSNMVTFNGLVTTMLATYSSTYPNFDIDYVDMRASLSADAFNLCDPTGAVTATVIANCYDDTTHFNDLGYQHVAKQLAACLNNPDAAYCDSTP